MADKKRPAPKVKKGVSADKLRDLDTLDEKVTKNVKGGRMRRRKRMDR